MNKIKYIIGIDEAGRGPLAGPVSVGVAMVSIDFDWGQIPGVNDSKKLTEKKREEIFAVAHTLKKKGELDYAVSMVSARVIDKIGIIFSVQRAMNRCLSRLEKQHPYSTVNRTIGVFREEVNVKLDGGLRAPEAFVYQETIIKGDSKEKVIGLASIVAKVTRDRYMVRIGSKPQFAPYTFATHKGYGTKAHREAIAEYGISTEHRKSYCKNIEIL